MRQRCLTGLLWEVMRQGRESLSEVISSSIPLRFCEPLHMGFHMRTCSQSSSLNFSHHRDCDYRLWRDTWAAPGIMHKTYSHILGALASRGAQDQLLAHWQESWQWHQLIFVFTALLSHQRCCQLHVGLSLIGPIQINRIKS